MPGRRERPDEGVMSKFCLHRGPRSTARSGMIAKTSVAFAAYFDLHPRVQSGNRP